jgi:hypothetical protein
MGIKIKYPANWDKVAAQPGYTGTLRLAFNSPAVSVQDDNSSTLAVELLPAKYQQYPSIKSVANILQDESNRDKDYRDTVTNQKSITINGVHAIMYETYSKPTNLRIHSIQGYEFYPYIGKSSSTIIKSPNNNEILRLTYSADSSLSYDKYLPIAQQMINSLQFIPSNNNMVSGNGVGGGEGGGLGTPSGDGVGSNSGSSNGFSSSQSGSGNGFGSGGGEDSGGNNPIPGLGGDGSNSNSGP